MKVGDFEDAAVAIPLKDGHYFVMKKSGAVETFTYCINLELVIKERLEPGGREFKDAMLAKRAHENLRRQFNEPDMKDVYRYLKKKKSARRG